MTRSVSLQKQLPPVRPPPNPPGSAQMLSPLPPPPLPATNTRSPCHCQFESMLILRLSLEQSCNHNCGPFLRIPRTGSLHLNSNLLTNSERHLGGQRRHKQTRFCPNSECRVNNSPNLLELSDHIYQHSLYQLSPHLWHLRLRACTDHAEV